MVCNIDENTCISPGTYFMIYFIIVVLIFFLVYIGFSYTLNEGEALVIALIAGLLFLSIFINSVASEADNYSSIEEYQQLLEGYIISQILTWIIITFTIIFTILIGIGFFTFGKTCHNKIYFRKY